MSLVLGAGDEGGYSLCAFQSELDHALASIAPDSVVLLEPEPTGSLKWRSTVERVFGETVLVGAASARGIPVERASRASVRGSMKLGRAGSLSSHAEAAYPDKVGAHWADKRHARNPRIRARCLRVGRWPSQPPRGVQSAWFSPHNHPEHE